jgi:hypothetical protein
MMKTMTSLDSTPIVAVTETEAAVMELLARYRAESKGGGILWVSVAKNIVTILESQTPEDAEGMFRSNARGFKAMTISNWYLGAADRLAEAIAQDKNEKNRQT